MQACCHRFSSRQFFGALSLITAMCCVGSLNSAEPEPRAKPIATSATLETARQHLLAAAKLGDPDFPDEKRVKLMHFSYVGSLKTKDGAVLVVDRRSVLNGMLAPRGLNFITFFDDQLKYLGKFQYIKSRPLYCDGGKLFLFGALDGRHPGGDGNVIDVTDGYESLKICREYSYGSSGGIADRPKPSSATQ
jgi:hypothetical protein